MKDAASKLSAPTRTRVKICGLRRVEDALANGVDRIRVFSGYSGWIAGQLEREMAEEGWFVCDPRPEDIFTEHPAEVWRNVLQRQRGELAMFAFYPDELGKN